MTPTCHSAVRRRVQFFHGYIYHLRRRGTARSFHRALRIVLIVGTKTVYRQTVLGAFAQVADSLRALDHDAQTLQAEEESLAAADQALHLIQTNYQAGLATYLDVLNADAQYHQATIADIQAIAVRYQDTVALFAALGGGWWNVDRTGAGAGASMGK